MTTVISLDSGPLSLVTFPKPATEADACKQWLASGLDAASLVIATTNVGHLSRFVHAETWDTI